ADFVIWSDNPLSVYAVVEQTWIDGKKYFDLEDDSKMRLAIKEEKSALIQKALASKDSDDEEDKGSYTKAAREWHCDDIDDVWRMGR
ncbi:MAG: hypothetical protein IIB00_07710, partial [candidate division Zixibacteria bacterium]|nr:hypothetical protein [candidate division Zixibacteria bacterium]